MPTQLAETAVAAARLDDRHGGVPLMSRDEPLGTLRDVEATLLIPLIGRALGRSRYPSIGFADPASESLVERLHIDTNQFDDDPTSLIGSCLRALWFDEHCRDFIAAHPGALVVSLGSGLNTAFQRLDDGRVHWVDVELPDVAALRRRLLPDCERCRTLAADITDPAWTESVGWRRGQPLLLVLEGVIMYLQRSEARQLFQTVADAFAPGPGDGPVELLLDYASPSMVRNEDMHPSLRKVGVRMHAGLEGGADLSKIDPRFRVREEHDLIAECSPWHWSMSLWHQLMNAGHFFYGCTRVALQG